MEKQICIKCGKEKTGILKRIVNGKEILENIDLKYFDSKEGEFVKTICLTCTAKENSEKRKAESGKILIKALQGLTK